jgi:hypothetical protein
MLQENIQKAAYQTSVSDKVDNIQKFGKRFSHVYLLLLF